ncbi:methylenetetrahydrofolate--tRNA-(uracil(54)-C(5))-methyltransferase (FADH(2)-oxidizing) TrmFO [Bulleidia sp. zg-1013]|uniref:methylenetetrahydrofolate--tRNA-(uracil(54)- C(5))-methyltransferase (FADH(2)-oxidizing) TrmFO n=1 Tax=Bacillati TaxID=1783272 RepID=UPI001C6ED14D|nr:methylenetetrahydrofolate--tRNA-(uracil(54)-C(5))-methyltransferase (FADH(2)-oxidizing) TrmFO [Trueperella sp. zg.1013]
MRVRVIGAGLAGCEASYQLAKRGFEVDLYEMKPKKFSPAHRSENFAELVCSNSFRSDALTNAVGVLKNELRMMDSFIMKVADETKIPAGSALAVDREQFSSLVTKRLKEMKNITLHYEEIEKLDTSVPTIVASGPLSSKAISKSIQDYFQEKDFYFYDAVAPIVTVDSIDFTKAYRKSRYDKGSDDYINCPMNQEEFLAFYQAVITAETAETHDFEKELYFEGCMPFEVMAKRGMKTLLFGPMKPVGLKQEGKEKPYAVVQLRQDNATSSLYNIVGFQTHLKWSEQKKVIHLIPGLEKAEIVRYGVMHRNSYINSPKYLEDTYRVSREKYVFFAGQMTGVEGYIESCASGFVAAVNMAQILQGKEEIHFGQGTMIGAMAHYISHASQSNFQPMNANFGIMNLEKIVKKKEKKEAYAPQSVAHIKELKEKYGL